MLKKNQYFIEMLALAEGALKNSYSPYSTFKVGSCIRSGNQLYAGCNVENIVNGNSFCAEANAIGTMISNGDKKIEEVLVVVEASQPVPCCGSCLQKLLEFGHSDTIIHLCTVGGEHIQTTLQDLLPVPFTPKHVELL